MSYLGTALTRLTEQHGLIQADLSRKTGLSRAHISRVCNGEAKDLSDEHFGSVLKVFAGNPRSQAELIVARCMDARVGPGSEFVEISIKKPADTPNSELRTPRSPELPEHIHLSRETEKAFAWLRSQCPINPDLEKHLVGYARMLGMK